MAGLARVRRAKPATGPTRTPCGKCSYTAIQEEGFRWNRHRYAAHSRTKICTGIMPPTTKKVSK
jgi:hypothetical protein